jgi:hypothetical protein
VHSVNWLLSLKVGQCKRSLSIPAIYSANQGKQRRIRANLKQRPIAKSPSARRKIEWEELNLSEKWFHEILLCLARESQKIE